MGNDSYPVQATASGTTTLGSRLLYGINLNKVLTGTVTIKDGTTTLGTIAVSTAAGPHWLVPSQGTRFANLVVVLSAADDVTLFVRNL